MTPLLLAGLGYGLMSLITYAVYAADKAAARRKRRRVTGRTLHLLALLGGWPGALLAQQFLRHKSTKASFRSAFWGTVLLNVGAFIAMSSPWIDVWKRLA